jgi:hypothetical protein
MDTNLKLGRKLPELNQHCDLLPQQELQALEMKVLRPRAIVNCVSKSRSQRTRLPPCGDTIKSSMRTLGVGFACAFPLLSSRFQCTLACLKCTVFIRLIRLVEIILRCYDSRESLSQVGYAQRRMWRHIPEGRDPRCRRRARLLAPCAIAGNHTRYICAGEP